MQDSFLKVDISMISSLSKPVLAVWVTTANPWTMIPATSILVSSIALSDERFKLWLEIKFQPSYKVLVERERESEDKFGITSRAKQIFLLIVICDT